ncbi:hypothetical protein [Flavobacterium piscisymbiosum]|uniref:Uncharacterized protein n=1 Tax=Flavobacterium piscisymbiosum TaxID=2893753 RepID=A0ABS8M8G5_9FLAO|nr:hypothetical protein [Flavobacterium sp. F-30]MCC9061744.1 hypothetical protein [Flavobacterium sp. F-30]
MVNSIEERFEMIVFCQAPADIPYFLSLYEKYKGKKIINVYVVNVENVFKFIESLNLNLNSLVFIPYGHLSIKNFALVFKERKRINFFAKKYFKGVVNNDVYFFSRFEDWLTSAFLVKLSDNNSLYYVDHYDFSADLFDRKKMNFKRIILKFILFIITGANFKLEILEKIPEFHFKRYNIRKIAPDLTQSVFDLYKYQIKNIQDVNPIVIFFISPCEDSIYEPVSHDSIQLKIIESFKKHNWTVVVKGHPRIGIPENVMHLVDIEIPSYIPAEFLEFSNSSMYIGIITSSLSHFVKENQIPTYSLINLFQFKEIGLADKYKNYLNGLTNNKIKYFENFENFENVIKSIS